MGLAWLDKLGPVGRTVARFFLGKGAAIRTGVIAAAKVAGAVAGGGSAGASVWLAGLAGGALGVVGTLLGTYLLHKVSRALGGG